MKYLTFIILIFLVIAGCSKKDEETIPQSEIDDQTIKEYLSDNNLQATKHSSGLYYHIYKEGEGEHPTLSSEITVYYKGSLLDGTVFDQTGSFPSKFKLNNMINGWRIGIPLLKPGGKAYLYIPSGLGYGNRDYGDIPANSVLIFDVMLVDILN